VFRPGNCRIGSSGVHLSQKGRGGARRTGARDRKRRKDGDGADGRFGIIASRGSGSDRSWREKPQLVEFKAACARLANGGFGLIESVVGRTNQGTGFDVPEAHLLA
jgi:hypothetical protein